MHKYIDEILQYIRDQFVSGKVSSAKNMIYDCVVVTQNRHCITILDRAAYGELWMCERKEREREFIFFSCSSKSLLYERNQVRNTHSCMLDDTACMIIFPFPINREVFRQLFGAPNDKKTYMKVGKYQ